MLLGRIEQCTVGGTKESRGWTFFLRQVAVDKDKVCNFHHEIL